MKIEIFGDGDNNFIKLKNNTKDAIINLKLITKIQYPGLYGLDEKHNHNCLPALYINDNLICAGKYISTKEIETKIKNN